MSIRLGRAERSSIPRNSILTAAAAAAALFLDAACAGLLRVPLPAPAHGKYVNLVPKGVLPWTPHPLQVRGIVFALLLQHTARVRQQAAAAGGAGVLSMLASDR